LGLQVKKFHIKEVDIFFAFNILVTKPIKIVNFQVLPNKIAVFVLKSQLFYHFCYDALK